MRGVPLPVVSRLLGHKRPSMTLRYAHVGDRETEAARSASVSQLRGRWTVPGCLEAKREDCGALRARAL